MQQRNVLSLEYLDNCERIADYVNVVFLDGNEVVRPDDIQEMDSVVRRIRKRWGQLHTRTFTRDILRKVIMGTRYFIVGIEHQSQIDFTMPVRVMGYDVGVYEKQLRKLKRLHRAKRDLRGAEFMCGISRHDRLMPAVTGIIYFGEEEWNGPRNLHGMLDMSGKLSYLKKWVPNYRINVVEARRYPEWEMFKSDLGQVFGYLQNATDGKSIQKYIKEHKKEYEDLEEDAFDIISAVTNATELMKMKEKSRNKEGRINMCKALQEWAEMERVAGRSEGRILGKIEGKVEGKAEGRAEGKAEGKAESIGIIRRKLNQGLSQEAINHWMELDESYVLKIAELNERHPNDSDEKIAAMYLNEKNPIF